MTSSQIDKLGLRLREGHRDEATLRMLDAMYDAYGPVEQEISSIVRSVTANMGFESQPDFASRPTKSLPSIVAKLTRERTRLSSMQDLIGCRVIVQDRREQRTLADSLRPPNESPSAVQNRPLTAVTIDRNVKPMHGYRALHLIVTNFRFPYEIQIRTQLQDRWAQVSERTDDLFPGTKYGNGPASVQGPLLALSTLTDEVETDYLAVMDLPERYVGEMDDRFFLSQEKRVREAIVELSKQYDEFEETVRNLQR